MNNCSVCQKGFFEGQASITYCSTCHAQLAAGVGVSDAELSALRAELEAVKAHNRAEVKGITTELQEMVAAAEAEVVRLNRMISDALLDPSEVARLRKVAEAARECYENDDFITEGDMPAKLARDKALGTALAGLGEPEQARTVAVNLQTKFTDEQFARMRACSLPMTPDLGKCAYPTTSDPTGPWSDKPCPLCKGDGKMVACVYRDGGMVDVDVPCPKCKP